jgi:hypothetical protein
MSVQAEIQNEKNEKFGLSQLDLVKHALKTIIHSLQDQDRLSLVSFANSATVWFQLTKMDADGKSSALAALNRLEVRERERQRMKTGNVPSELGQWPDESLGWSSCWSRGARQRSTRCGQ